MRIGIVLALLCVMGAAASGGILDAGGIEMHGFLDVRGGARLQDDPNQDGSPLGELRLQCDLTRFGDYATYQLRFDVLHDEVAGERTLDLDRGTGLLDLREANVLVSPLSVMDLKVGRQILTWGTGDMIFINDLFPKDWQSFFAGRDEEYLKAPSDAVFISMFPFFGNIDIAYVPRFDPDRFISGSRFSYWSPMRGARVGENAVVDPLTPDVWFVDDEVSARLYRNVAGYELALYAYDGFWKSPAGMDTGSGRAMFPELGVYGASLRGALGSGIASLEGGYYDSRDDRHGDDPLRPNSEVRGLCGFEREVARDLTMGLQYYLEHMVEYGAYERSLPSGMAARDENRHVLTARLTKQAMSQTLVFSLFVYYSPSDEDGYVRPAVRYKATDAWLLTAGGNLFFGEEDHTFFGQFEENSNVYAGARYSF